MNLKAFKRLFSYMKNYKLRFNLAVIAAIIGTSFTVIAPMLLGYITTTLSYGVSDGIWNSTEGVDPSYVCTIFGTEVSKVEYIVFLIVVLTIMYVASLLFCGYANNSFSHVTALIIKDMRTDIEAKMHKLSLNYFDTHVNGDVLSIITNDVDAVNTLLGKNMYQIITSAVTLIGVLIMLVTSNIWMALIAAALIPVTLISTAPLSKKNAKYYAAEHEILGEVNGYVEEIYSGQNVISSFNYQDKAAERFDNLNEELQKKAQKAEKFSGGVMPVTQMVNNIGYGIAGLVGCIFAINGIMAIGTVQSALQYVKTFQQPFSTVASMSGQLSDAMAACDRIFELLDEEEEIPDPESGLVPENCNGTVAFKNVQFGYTTDHLLMTDVSIDVGTGQKCAIVGPTGAGKTTLINLLMRFYEINGGKIIVDGVDSGKMTRHELRTHFGMVLQDTWLFEGTIRDNLKYGADREVSDEEMIEAAKSVCADSFIRTMPGGYDMMLSKGAENISQGQRQLLTIVRAIIADPEIMILDEATSNVDAHTEQTIQNAMATLLKGRTSFVIAHRLSTIRDANMILYMENGDIKEVGDHETLMAKGGKYADLYNSQFAG